MQKYFDDFFTSDLYDVDCFGNTKMSSFMERMLLAGNRHSNANGWSWTHLAEDLGICMVLVRTHTEFYKEPGLFSNIQMKTWPMPKMYPIIVRNFLVTDDKGEKVAEAIIHCVLMDMKTRSIVNGADYGLSLPEKDDAYPEIKTLPYKFPKAKIRELAEKTPDKTYKMTVSYSDLDYNGHMNTARYISHMENLLGAGFFKAHSIISYDCSYNEEAKPGEELIYSEYLDADNSELFVLAKHEDTVCYEAHVKYKNN